MGRLLEPQIQTYEEAMAEFERLAAIAQTGDYRKLTPHGGEWKKEDILYFVFDHDATTKWHEVRVGSLEPKKTIRLVVKTIDDTVDRRLISWQELGNLTYEIINSPLTTGVNVISDNDCIGMVYNNQLRITYEGERYKTVWTLDVDRDENVTVDVEGEAIYDFSLKNV